LEPASSSSYQVGYDFLGILICLVFSAFFSGTETALTALSNARISQLSEQYPYLNRLLKRWQEKPALILSTILIGNNLVNILGAVLAGRIANYYLQDYAEAAAVGVMTFIVLMIGEITPKTYSKLNSERVVKAVIPFLQLIDLILYPFSFLLSRFASRLVRILGSRNPSDTSGISQSEIEYLIKTGSRLGVFDQKEHADLLNSALDFRETLVEEVMIPRTSAHFLSDSVTVAEAMEKISEWGNSRIPVYHDSFDQVVGLLFSKDLIQLQITRQISLDDSITGIIRKPLLYVPERQKIQKTLSLMQADRIHLAIVLDEYGGTSGIITLEDILEELVGDILDEYDSENIVILKGPGNRLVVDAGMSVDDLSEKLGIPFPDNNDYHSVGGFLISQSGNVPQKGYKFRYRSLQFRVIDADKRHIKKIEIRQIMAPSESTADLDSAEG